MRTHAGREAALNLFTGTFQIRMVEQDPVESPNGLIDRFDLQLVGAGHSSVPESRWSNKDSSQRGSSGGAAASDRFTSLPEIAVGLLSAGRDYSLGWRLIRGGGSDGSGSLELSVEVQRRESANDVVAPEHGIGFRLTARF